MTISFFASQIGRYVSILAFITLLMMAYQQMPADVSIEFSPSGGNAKVYSKEVIFYTVAGFMLLANMGFLWMMRLFPKLPDGFIKLPGAVKWMFYRKQLNAIVAEWLNFGAVFVNMLLAVSVYILSAVNAPEVKQPLSRFEWVLGVACFLLVLWVVYVPMRLLLTNPVKED
ncbi:hypothetical protein [Siphonobacter aquaeclarae]|uniref:DUF1648 domain-containing protein n=1 Tax=Siphonobacter aquaeclarae TaxID=563176 RepID=A0A1G9XG60_9BACT|nr:hypothetical protein [Siphonobacter aquaeclarae]SDM95511.1 hypothetical protein SAMN04488090_4596 [Siphonobacter aquaeclarae]